MEGMPNRKQRRLMAKQAGFMRKKANASPVERAEMAKRSMEIGKQIHLFNTERDLRAQEESQRILEQSKISRLVEQGYTPEEALRVFREENEPSK